MILRLYVLIAVVSLAGCSARSSQERREDAFLGEYVTVRNNNTDVAYEFRPPKSMTMGEKSWLAKQDDNDEKSTGQFSVSISKLTSNRAAGGLATSFKSEMQIHLGIRPGAKTKRQRDYEFRGIELRTQEWQLDEKSGVVAVGHDDEILIKMFYFGTEKGMVSKVRTSMRTIRRVSTE